jgi:hypothetical protein
VQGYVGVLFQRWHLIAWEMCGMQQRSNGIILALRTLTAINDGRHPSTADVQALGELAPDIANQPVDALACEVVERAMKLRTKQHENGGKP